jgi:superfamily I DNA and/or RNA helicase
MGSICNPFRPTFYNKMDFVILTPYKKQIRLLNNYLPQERNDLKILTVHGSQGREWETVILSVVDTTLPKAKCGRSL